MTRPLDLLLVLAPPVWRPEAPPMGLTYLHEHALAAGLASHVLDLNERVYTTGGDAVRALWRMDHHADLIAHRVDGLFAAMRPAVEAVLAPLLDPPPAVLGFSTYHLNQAVAVRVARFVRERAPGTRIVWGGPSMCEDGERARLPGDVVDFVVLGEAETRLPALARAVTDGTPVPAMPGLLAADAYARPVPRAEAFVVDGPAPGLFPRYATAALPSYLGTYLPLLAARGCRFHCAFCNDHFTPLRKRPARDVVAEVRHHVFTHGITDFFFADQSLDGDPAHLAEVVGALLAARLPVTWRGQLNVRKGLSPELFARMKRAGCTFLSWGVESLADPVLRRARKPSTAALAVEALTAAHAAGISQLAYLIVGLPGETEETFRATLSGVARIAPLVARLSIMPCQVTPFSPIAEDPAAFGVDLSVPDAKDHWRSVDGTNTHAARMDWLARLARRLIELGVPFQSPVVNRPRWAELLGRELPPGYGGGEGGG